MTNYIIIDNREEVHLVMRPMTGQSGHGGWRRVITQFRRAAGVRFAPTLKEDILFFFFLPASSLRLFYFVIPICWLEPHMVHNRGRDAT
jgi:hypothetical protein